MLKGYTYNELNKRLQGYVNISVDGLNFDELELVNENYMEYDEKTEEYNEPIWWYATDATNSNKDILERLEYVNTYYYEPLSLLVFNCCSMGYDLQGNRIFNLKEEEINKTIELK